MGRGFGGRVVPDFPGWEPGGFYFNGFSCFFVGLFLSCSSVGLFGGISVFGSPVGGPRGGLFQLRGLFSENLAPSILNDSTAF